MSLITTCGLNVSQGQLRIPTTTTLNLATIFIPNLPAIISTTDLAPGSNVTFNTNVPSVSGLVTINVSATMPEDQPVPALHSQLQE